MPASMAQNGMDESLGSRVPDARVLSRGVPTVDLDVAHAPARFVIALVGLAFEARIASGPGVVVICRSTESNVAISLGKAVKKGCRSVISFGVAGGLAPHLVPGDWIVASSVIDAQHVHPTDKVWSEKMLNM